MKTCETYGHRWSLWRKTVTKKIPWRQCFRCRLKEFDYRGIDKKDWLPQHST